MLNPLNTNKIYLRAYIVVWLQIILIHGIVLHFIGEIDWLEAFGDSLVFNSLFGIVGFGIWYVVRYTKLDASQMFNINVNHLAASIILVALWLYGGKGLLNIIFANNIEYQQFLGETVLRRGIIGFLYYIIITVNYYLILYYKEFEDQKLRESEMNRLLKETELSMLKTQINPHFIFNSLNSVGSLTITAPEKAHDMVIKLSSFLRYTIASSKSLKISLKEEIDATKLYLDIEKIRFGDKLKVTIKCDEDTDNLLLPQLILQPLVENAIKYGVYESTEESHISIKCHQHKDQVLIVEIENDIEIGGVPNKGKGIGLKNVRSRIELMYDESDLLEVKESESKFYVKLKFPQ